MRNREPDSDKKGSKERVNSYLRAKEIFLETIELPKAQQLNWVKKCCGDDASLFNNVVALLEHDSNKAQGSDALHKVPLSNAMLESSVLANHQQVYGPYRITNLLGQGGMGNVFLGQRVDGEFNRDVAIKVGHFRLRSENHKAKFLFERQTLADLQHVAICRLLDGGTTDKGNPYIVMEYIDGVSITQFSNDNDLNLEDRLSLFIRVCEGVQYSHEHSVIHRDIKPENVLVNNAGEPKLIDFGIAKHTVVDNEHNAVDGSVTRIYTPDYASPEQVLGKKLSTSTDIYSLGVLLYRLLTDEKPFSCDAQSIDEIEKSRLKGPKPIQSTELLGMTGVKGITGKRNISHKARLNDLNAILRKVLSYETSRRYQTTAQFIEDINNYLQNKPVSATKPNPMQKLYLWHRRHKLASVALVFLGVTIVSSLWGLSFKNNQLLHERDIARNQSERADAINSVLINAFEQVDPYNANGQKKSALDVLNLASKEIITLDNVAPHIKSSLHMSVGKVYLNMSSFSEAKQHFLAAQEVKGVGQNQLYTELSVSMGLVELGLGNLDLAMERAETVILNFAPTNPQKNATVAQPSIASAHYLQGRVYQDQAKWDEAVAAHEKAHELYTLSNSYSEHALVQNRVFLAKALLSKRAYEQAEVILLELEKVLSENKKTLTPDYAQVQSILAYLYWYQDRWPEAEALLTKQLIRVTRLFGEQSDLLIDTAGMMATVKTMLKKTDEAIEFHEMALDVAEKKYGASHIKLIGLTVNYGNFLERAGKFAEAEVTLDKALALSLATLGESHDTTNYAKWTLGKVKGRLGNLATCIQLMKEAEVFFANTYNHEEYPLAEIQQALGVAHFFSQQLPQSVTYLELSQSNLLKRASPNPKIINENFSYLSRIFSAQGEEQRLEEAYKLVEPYL